MRLNDILLNFIEYIIELFLQRNLSFILGFALLWLVNQRQPAIIEIAFEETLKYLTVSYLNSF